MRKRSKYKPKPVLLNPLGYVMESIAPVTAHAEYLRNLRILHHGAMRALTRGTATRDDVDILIQMANVTEALWMLGIGKDFGSEVRDGHEALFEVGKRGALTGRYVCKAPEIVALNLLIELHDAQLDVVVVKDIERAIALVRREQAAKRVKFIPTQKETQ